MTIDLMSGRPMPDRAVLPGPPFATRVVIWRDAVHLAMQERTTYREAFVVLSVRGSFFVRPLATSGAFGAHVAFVAS